jgi:mono/diheme cytochrome c family protein
MPFGFQPSPLPKSRRDMLNTLYLHLRMVRLVAAAALALVLATGCMGEITNGANGDDVLTPEEIAAKNAFDQTVTPILGPNCGGCHTSMANIDFMKPAPDVRTHLLTWPGLVNLDTPTSSKLLTKGAHSGPAFTPEQSAAVLDWINLEKVAAGGPTTTVETQAFQPMPGVNTVDLTAIGLPGSTITFRLQQLSVGIYINELTVHASADGVHLVHPLFVTWDAQNVASPDPVDRFADIDLTVAASQTSSIGGGTAVFVDVAPTTKLSLHFLVAAKATGGTTTGGGGTTGGGCKAVAAFTQFAQPLLSANCAGCHAGGNAGATSATDMSKINDTSATAQAAACAQILSRIDKATPANSGMLVTVNPGKGLSHPFKFGGNQASYDAYEAQMLMWINQEIQ